MSDESLALDAAAAITTLGDPFRLVPVIEDILRTRYCVPGSIFLVEGIDAITVSRSGRWKAIRLLLGDGELCIQALLAGDLHRFVDTGEVGLGSYVRCDDFGVRWHAVVDDAEARPMVYLVVQQVTTVGWNESYRALQLEEKREDEPEVEGESAERPSLDVATEVKGAPTAQRTDDLGEDDPFDDDAFEGFNTPPALAPRNEGYWTKTPRIEPPKTETPKTVQKSNQCIRSQPVALPRDWHDAQTPLKLTTLRSIPHLPYKQNWSCNILAIVTSLSPIEPSNLPPGKQRTARIADPSTAKHVHLTVFLDPEAFTPRVGSAILLVGVKNHRFDGGSLKKYASDRTEGGPGWWFEEPWDLGWCDVQGIKAWWADVQQALQE